MTEHNQKRNTGIPSVIAVVLNWNGYDDTVQCVLSLQQVFYSNLQIIIVDNGSADGSATRLEQTFPALTMIKLPENTGYAAGNNAGIKAALAQGADYVLVLNNDTTVERDFLQPMVEAAERDATVGIVTCKVYYQDEPNRIYAAGGTFKRWLCTGVNDQQREIDGPGEKHNEHERDITFVPGCVMLIRRSVLEKSGLLDERFFLYFEDLEFSRRVNKHFRLVYMPQGKIYHKCGAGQSWSSYTPTYFYYQTRNRLWAFKHDLWFYRVYVIGVAFAIALAKSLVLLSSDWKNASNPSQDKMHAIWRGLRDGLRTIPQ